MGRVGVRARCRRRVLCLQLGCPHHPSARLVPFLRPQSLALMREQPHDAALAALLAADEAQAAGGGRRNVVGAEVRWPLGGAFGWGGPKRGEGLSRGRVSLHPTALLAFHFSPFSLCVQDHDKNMADDPSQRLTEKEKRKAAAQERRRLKAQAQAEACAAAAAAAAGAAQAGGVMTRSMRAAARLKMVRGLAGWMGGVLCCCWEVPRDARLGVSHTLRQPREA